MGRFVKTRGLLREGWGVRKRPEGVEVRNKLCSFVFGDNRNPLIYLVYKVLKILGQHMNEVQICLVCCIIWEGHNSMCIILLSLKQVK